MHQARGLCLASQARVLLVLSFPLRTFCSTGAAFAPLHSASCLLWRIKPNPTDLLIEMEFPLSYCYSEGNHFLWKHNQRILHPLLEAFKMYNRCLLGVSPWQSYSGWGGCVCIIHTCTRPGVLCHRKSPPAISSDTSGLGPFSIRPLRVAVAEQGASHHEEHDEPMASWEAGL